MNMLVIPNIVRICPKWSNFISDNFNNRRSVIFDNSDNSGLIESGNVDDDACEHNWNYELDHSL